MTSFIITVTPAVYFFLSWTEIKANDPSKLAVNIKDYSKFKHILLTPELCREISMSFSQDGKEIIYKVPGLSAELTPA
jgi:hypothetical protein